MNLSRSLVTCLMATLGSFALASCQSATSELAGQPQSPPNIVFIIVDDLGYTDLGVFGSEIPTPNIDALARSGVQLTNFHSNATCGPSRAMLLSGHPSHAVGFGLNPGTSNRLPVLKTQPSYQGVWPGNIETIAQRLNKAGYFTAMAGKWHLGKGEESAPLNRGFERAFHLENGGGSHFPDRVGQTSREQPMSYFDEGQFVEQLPDDFFSSQFYVDKTIEYIDEADGRPFFAYLSFTAAHWPLQAPDDWIDRFAGQYDAGWEAVRAARISRMAELGLVAPDFVPPAFPSAIGKWSELSSQDQKRESRRMEIYAAMIAHMDAQVGRLVDHLKATGQYEDTVIIFMSDNGPEGNDVANGLADNRVWIPQNFDQSLGNMGRPNSYTTLGRGWAHVSAGPFRRYKSYMTEGGVRVPAILSYPARVEGGTRYDGLISIMDIAPTVEALGQPDFEPYSSGARPFLSFDEQGSANFVERETLTMEIYGNKAVWRGKWKLLWSWSERDWKLFDMSVDPAERNDLSGEHPELVEEMRSQWTQFASENGVYLFDQEVGYARYSDQAQAAE